MTTGGPFSDHTSGNGADSTPRSPLWEEASKALSLSDLLSLCFRRWLPFILAAVTVAILVYAATTRITPLYEAKAQLEIVPSGKLLDFQSNPDQQHIDYALLNTVRDRIIATPVLEQVIKHTDIAKGPRYSGINAVALLRSRIHVTISRDSWIIELALRDEDRSRAEKALRSLLESYFERMNERETARSSSALTFLREQVAEARSHFDQAQDAEEDFRLEHGITSPDPDNNPHARRVQELERLRIGVEGDLTAAQALVDQIAAAQVMSELQRPDALLAIAAIANHALVSESRRLLELRRAEAEVLAHEYGPKHPRMKSINDELTIRTEQLGDAVKKATAAFVANLQELRLRLTALTQRIQVEDEALARYRVDLLRMQALSQESLTRGKLFDELRRGFAEQEVSSRLESRQVVENSPPEASGRPANVYPSLFAAASVLFGGIAGLIAAFITERLDRTLRGEAGLRALVEIPILAAIPALDGLLPTLTRARDADRPAQIGEAFRALRVGLRLTSQFRDAAEAERGCCLLITSPGEGEGRSTVASRLAVSLAAAGAQVLLIDGDLRQPSLHTQFGIQVGGGLSLLLAGEPQHATRTAFPNLDLLWAGQRPPNPADLLHSSALAWYIDQARTRYDWVVFDAPPITRFADTVVLGEHADAVVMVVRDRVTSRVAITQAMRRLQALHHRLVGVVLNASRDDALAAQPDIPEPPAVGATPLAENGQSPAIQPGTQPSTRS